jgi:hypothetical protein
MMADGPWRRWLTGAYRLNQTRKGVEADFMNFRQGPRARGLPVAYPLVCDMLRQS